MTVTPRAQAADVAIAFLQAFWDGDGDRAAALCTPDAEWHFAQSLDYPSPMPASEAVVRVNQDMLQLFEPDPGLSIEILSVINDDGAVAVEYEATGKTKNGRDYRNRYLMRIDIEDGKVASVRPYTDTLHLTNVLFGAQPSA